eukprot:UN32932
MGMFAIYNGLIYNDVTSISINGFNGTQWEDVTIENYPEEGQSTTVENGRATGVYGFGVDPVWATSGSQLDYLNSLKMKLSVIVGIAQMTFGLFIKLSNHLHEGDYLSIIGEFVPQLIFMLVFFTYMQFIIIFKWCKDWSGKEPPSLITVLVDMVLKPGTVTEGDTQLFDNKDTQIMVQVVFVLLMMLSIPWMLLVKPLVLNSRYKRAVAAGEDAEALMHGHGGHGDEPFQFSSIMIEQVIHTIEYVLGTISNT